MKRQLLILTLPAAAAPSRARCAKALRALGLRLEGLVEIPAPASGPALTRRQLEVLRDMTLGLTTKEIARKLRIGVKTVETHRQLLTAKLNIRQVPGLVRYALRTGVLPASWILEREK
ncbi:MAG TPA: LuxR C-terminal-related transcriptional regulator [Planctomycetota bacterium]